MQWEEILARSPLALAYGLKTVDDALFSGEPSRSFPSTSTTKIGSTKWLIDGPGEHEEGVDDVVTNFHVHEDIVGSLRPV